MVYLYFCFVILEYLNRVTIGPNGSLICYRLKSHVIYIKYFKEIASLSLNLLCLSLYPFISDYFLFKLTGQTAILSPTYSFVFSWAKRVRKNLSRTKCFFLPSVRPSVRLLCTSTTYFVVFTLLYFNAWNAVKSTNQVAWTLARRHCSMIFGPCYEASWRRVAQNRWLLRP